MAPFFNIRTASLARIINIKILGYFIFVYILLLFAEEKLVCVRKNSLVQDKS